MTKPSDGELADALKKHIYYELFRLVAQYELLRDTKRYSTGLHKDEVEDVEDALIVSFCTHARNMLEFFFRTDPKGYGFALAINYADDKYEPPELQGRLGVLYRELCRQVNHLTMGRTDESNEKIGRQERDELIGIIHDEVERLARHHLRGVFDTNAQYFALGLLAEAKRKSTTIALGATGTSSFPSQLVSVDASTVSQQATHTTTPKLGVHVVKIGAPQRV